MDWRICIISLSIYSIGAQQPQQQFSKEQIEVCQLPRAKGLTSDCKDGPYKRYWYNAFQLQCEEFDYGCEGNENNFETIDDCELFCSGVELGMTFDENTVKESSIDALARSTERPFAPIVFPNENSCGGEKPKTRDEIVCANGEEVIEELGLWFNVEHHECLWIRRAKCASDQNAANFFADKDSCQRCIPQDISACTGLDVHPETSCKVGPNNEDPFAQCPIGYICALGAFGFGPCCNATQFDNFQAGYVKSCANNGTLAVVESLDSWTLPRLGKSCADNFCPQNYECIETEYHAHCCSTAKEEKIDNVEFSLDDQPKVRDVLKEICDDENENALCQCVIEETFTPIPGTQHPKREQEGGDCRIEEFTACQQEFVASQGLIKCDESGNYPANGTTIVLPDIRVEQPVEMPIFDDVQDSEQIVLNGSVAIGHQCHAIGCSCTIYNNFIPGTTKQQPHEEDCTREQLTLCQSEFVTNKAQSERSWTPMCDNDGNYRQVQCNSAACWCVNTQTGELTEEQEIINDDNNLPTCQEIPVEKVLPQFMADAPVDDQSALRFDCNAPISVGVPITGQTPTIRYFYDASRKKCRDFLYYGKIESLKGAVNNFEDEEACKKECMPSDLPILGEIGELADIPPAFLDPCKRDKPSVNESLNDSTSKITGWYYDQELEYCLATVEQIDFENPVLSIFESLDQCADACYLDEPLVCAQIAQHPDATQCRSDDDCQAPFTCAKYESYVGVCCDLSIMDQRSKDLQPECSVDIKPILLSESGSTKPILGKTCQDEFCEPGYECIDQKYTAWCCPVQQEFSIDAAPRLMSPPLRSPEVAQLACGPGSELIANVSSCSACPADVACYQSANYAICCSVDPSAWIDADPIVIQPDVNVTGLLNPSAVCDDGQPPIRSVDSCNECLPDTACILDQPTGKSICCGVIWPLPELQFNESISSVIDSVVIEAPNFDLITITCDDDSSLIGNVTNCRECPADSACKQDPSGLFICCSAAWFLPEFNLPNASVEASIDPIELSCGEGSQFIDRVSDCSQCPQDTSCISGDVDTYICCSAGSFINLPELPTFNTSIDYSRITVRCENDSPAIANVTDCRECPADSACFEDPTGVFICCASAWIPEVTLPDLTVEAPNFDLITVTCDDNAAAIANVTSCRDCPADVACKKDATGLFICCPATWAPEFSIDGPDFSAITVKCENGKNPISNVTTCSECPQDVACLLDENTGLYLCCPAGPLIQLDSQKCENNEAPIAVVSDCGECPADVSCTKDELTDMFLCCSASWQPEFSIDPPNLDQISITCDDNGTEPLAVVRSCSECPADVACRKDPTGIFICCPAEWFIPVPRIESSVDGPNFDLMTVTCLNDAPALSNVTTCSDCPQDVACLEDIPTGLFICCSDATSFVNLNQTFASPPQMFAAPALAEEIDPEILESLVCLDLRPPLLIVDSCIECDNDTVCFEGNIGIPNKAMCCEPANHTEFVVLCPDGREPEMVGGNCGHCSPELSCIYYEMNQTDEAICCKGNWEFEAESIDDKPKTICGNTDLPIPVGKKCNSLCPGKCIIDEGKAYCCGTTATTTGDEGPWANRTANCKDEVPNATKQNCSNLITSTASYYDDYLQNCVQKTFEHCADSIPDGNIHSSHQNCMKQCTYDKVNVDEICPKEAMEEPSGLCEYDPFSVYQDVIDCSEGFECLKNFLGNSACCNIEKMAERESITHPKCSNGKNAMQTLNGFTIFVENCKVQVDMEDATCESNQRVSFYCSTKEPATAPTTTTIASEFSNDFPACDPVHMDAEEKDCDGAEQYLWTYMADLLTCVKVKSKICRDQTTLSGNLFSTFDSCIQRCQILDGPTCALGGSHDPYLECRDISTGESIAECPQGFKCMNGAFNAECCNATLNEVYERHYHPKCDAYPRIGSDNPQLAVKCYDDLCPPLTYCFQDEKAAYCCADGTVPYDDDPETTTAEASTTKKTKSNEPEKEASTGDNSAIDLRQLSAVILICSLILV